MRNIAKIHAVSTTDEKIKILKFENFLSKEEIAKKYGEEVARIYFSSSYFYFYSYKRADKFFIWCPEIDASFYENEVVSKETFQLLISTLKKAGSNLKSIEKAVKEYKPFTVEI